MDMVKPDASKIDNAKPITKTDGSKPVAKVDAKPGLDTKATMAKPGAAPMASKPAVQASK